VLQSYDGNRHPPTPFAPKKDWHYFFVHQTYHILFLCCFL
jgi:hypothetical protein